MIPVSFLNIQLHFLLGWLTLIYLLELFLCFCIIYLLPLFILFYKTYGQLVSSPDLYFVEPSSNPAVIFFLHFLRYFAFQSFSQLRNLYSILYKFYSYEEQYSYRFPYLRPSDLETAPVGPSNVVAEED